MVIYNIKETPFKIRRSGYTFHFSSQYNVTRFLSKEENEIVSISASLSNRFKIYIKANKIAYFNLYRKIEKRGFYITDEKGECVEWLEV